MTSTSVGAERCSVLSEGAGEPLAGSAPTDTDWLLVEHQGAWGRKAVAESDLSPELRDHLAGLQGVRVQLLRRPGGRGRHGIRVFSARLGPSGATVRTALLGDADDLLRPVAWEAHPAPLWLVCTNGRRDVCCAARGRPVFAALAERWPEGTWETSHLGGHRFAGTLLALPSGLALGRLDASSAVSACADIEAGGFPLAVARGRAGLPGAAQAAEIAVRTEQGLTRSADAAVVAVEGGEVSVRTPGGDRVVRVDVTPGPPRRQSCADLSSKPAQEYVVRPA